MCFFHNLLQPLPRLHRCKRSSKRSTQCKCTVTPIGRSFFVHPIAAECWRGRGGKLSKKNTILNEHPVAPRLLIIVVSMFPRELISPSASLYEFPTAIHSEEGKDNIQQVDCVCACVCEREKEREREREREIIKGCRIVTV